MLIFIKRPALRIRSMVLNLWLRIPFGRICRVHQGASSMTLRKDFWIIVSDGVSFDTLPISAVSSFMQNELALRMRSVGYDINKYFDHLAAKEEVKTPKPLK